MNIPSKLLKTFCLSVLLALGFSVFPAFPQSPPPQPSYLIVRALNPEGAEIINIAHFSYNAVTVYDSGALIGYAGIKIAVFPGSHLIGVEFNGMLQEIPVYIGEGVTRTLNVTFERTEIDLKSLLSGFSGSLSGTRSHSGGYGGLTITIPESFEPPFSLTDAIATADFSCYLYGAPGHLLTTADYSVKLDYSLEYPSLNISGQEEWNCDKKDNVSGWWMAGRLVQIELPSLGAIFSNQSFDYWFVQDEWGSQRPLMRSPYYSLSLKGGSGSGVISHSDEVGSWLSAGHRVWYSVINARASWTNLVFASGEYVFFQCSDIAYEMISPHASLSIPLFFDGLKISSVPYDRPAVTPKSYPRAQFDYGVPNYPLSSFILGLDVVFKASPPLSGSSPIAQYLWEFSEGGTAQGAEVTHRYDQEGYYFVTLTITQPDGLQDKVRQLIPISKRWLDIKVTVDKPEYETGDKVTITCETAERFIPLRRTSVDTITGYARIPSQSENEPLSFTEKSTGLYEAVLEKTSKIGNYSIFISTEKKDCYPGFEVVTFPVKGEVGIFFDGSDYSMGSEVTGDVNTLAQGGTPVEGGVTDGVTRLLLRQPLDAPGQVNFTLQGTGIPNEDGLLRSTDRTPDDRPIQEGNSIAVNSVNVNGKDYAFAIYQAPENFVRQNNIDDLHTSERILNLQVDITGATSNSSFTKPIKLVRPPVVLVHGLWSSSKMWTGGERDDGYDFHTALANSFEKIRIFKPNYPNDVSFETNKEVIKKAIITAKNDLKQHKISMVQIDIIGHSMGGVLAKIWAEAGDYAYLSNKNFWAGDIHKLITLDSPLKGSFLADAGIACRNGPHCLKAHVLLSLMEFFGRSIIKGAVEDLMTTSPAMQKINSIGINTPRHSIIGHYADYSIQTRIDSNGNTLYIIVGLPKDYHDIHNVLEESGYPVISNVISGSDLVVSIDSQQGNLSIPASYRLWQHHTDVATNDTLGHVIELLNANNESNLFDK